jgi:uncharacterized repeat protein (TIGR03943 family)
VEFFDMAHDHHHHDDSTYYLEQLFTIGISAALGGVTIMLYWQDKLRYMLAPKFYLPVLLGGIALVVLAVVRAAALWMAVDRSIPVDNHNHNHAHDHDHHHGHDHDHAHEHAHDHTHESAAGHSHDHGHDHSWNPLRYVFLIIPIVLYIFDLPNAGFSNVTSQIDVQNVDITSHGAGEKKGQIIATDFKELEQSAYDPARRELFEGKWAILTGQFAPSADRRLFTLVRYKMTCCAADAYQLNVMIVSPENVNLKRDSWVEVTGQVQYAKRRDRDEYVTILQLSSAKDVRAVPPDKNPYIQ